MTELRDITGYEGLEGRPSQRRYWAAREKLRAAGWSVAVHNDYRVNGEQMTFWLFTHPDGRWAKGEGFSDGEALAAVLSALPAPPVKMDSSSDTVRQSSKGSASDLGAPLDAPSTALRAPIEFALAQLRHAYTKLVTGSVVDQRQLASGLLAPTIRRLEVALNPAEGGGRVGAISDQGTPATDELNTRLRSSCERPESGGQAGGGEA